jgi:hypothetical protein
VIKISPYTYMSFFHVHAEMFWSGWEINEYLFGIVIVYKKPLIK